MEQFNHYSPIWELDRTEALEEFMKAEPRLSEFEWQIQHYESLEQEINAQKEYYNVGSIALYTGRYSVNLKLFNGILQIVNFCL